MLYAHKSASRTAARPVIARPRTEVVIVRSREHSACFAKSAMHQFEKGMKFRAIR